MSAQQIPGLYYAFSKIHGRGIFCFHDIAARDVIEIAPVIVLPREASEWISHSPLYNYYFQWGTRQDQFAIALGYGSLYNHGSPANARFVPDYESEVITFSASRLVPAGEEITIDYHAGLRGHDLWFELHR